jgi:catechol 2,3-dioxygenase-like lactoylglutathione lyase family enzyme
MFHEREESVRASVDRVVPVLPVRDVAAALALYRRLGFAARAYDEQGIDGPVYGYLSWGAAELHLSLFRELDPATTTSACYLYIDDADALHAAWRDSGVAGRLHAPEDTPYGLREFAYVDPDGNLLRVGSPLRKTGA